MAFQVTSGSQREKWVAAFVPATAILLVAFLYITFFALPAFNKAEKDFKSAVGKAVGPELVAALDEDAKQLRRDRNALRDTMSSVEDEVTEKSKAFQQLSPTAKHSAVTALCRQHGVAILLDQTVESIRLPTLRDKSVKTLKSLVPSEAASFRELILTGEYAAIVELLRELPEIPGVIPISMTLTKPNRVDTTSPPVSWTVGLLM